MGDDEHKIHKKLEAERLRKYWEEHPEEYENHKKDMRERMKEKYWREKHKNDVWIRDDEPQDSKLEMGG